MLFIDPACPQPYSTATLRQRVMRGTEGTVARLIGAMPEAAVMQHNRAQADPGEPRFMPLRWDVAQGDMPVVVLRDIRVVLQARANGWRGPMFLWMHDLLDLFIGLRLPLLHELGVEVIAVSEWHRGQIVALARSLLGESAPLPKIRVIYNPLDADLAPVAGAPDPDQLCFVSAPHKGLNETLAQFQALRQRHPRLELHVACPGNTPGLDQPGVKARGELIHADAARLMAESFCVFYPNTGYPETFGLVYAEANAVGTPVLAHDFGAASEVLSDPVQLVDAYQPGTVAAHFEDWRTQGRPQVAAQPRFALDAVVAQWRGLLA